MQRTTLSSSSTAEIMITEAFLLLLFAASIPSALCAQGITAIVHGEVIDGNGGPPVADGVVLVRGDRIIAVGA